MVQSAVANMASLAVFVLASRAEFRLFRLRVTRTRELARASPGTIRISRRPDSGCGRPPPATDKEAAARKRTGALAPRSRRYHR